MMIIKSSLVICFLCFTTVLSIDLTCLFRDYKFYGWKSVYSCETQGLNIKSANETIQNIMSSQDSQESQEKFDFHEIHYANGTKFTYNYVLGLLINEEKCNYFPANVKDFFPHLELLQISHSQLNFIVKGNFNGLLKLEFVRIISNNIFNIPEDTFMGAENIVDLKMYSNNIRSVDENGFRGLVNLENLEISKNLISSIELNTFKDLVSLKYLHLSENDIVELPSKLFETNLKLEKLFVRSNKLTTVNVDLFLPLQLLQQANFDGNPCIDVDAPEDMSIEYLKKTLKAECTGVQKKDIIPENLEKDKALEQLTNMKQLEEKVLVGIDEFKKQVQNVIEDVNQQSTNGKQLELKGHIEIDGFKKQVEKAIKDMNQQKLDINKKLLEMVDTQIQNRDEINLLLNKVSLNEMLLNQTLIKNEQELLKLQNKQSTNVWNFLLVIIFVFFVIAFLVLLSIKIKSKLAMKNQNIAMTEALID